MSIFDPEKARSILERAHLLDYATILSRGYFTRGMTILFLFGTLAIVSVLLLLLFDRERYYIPFLVASLALSVLVAFLPVTGMSVSLPADGTVMVRAEKALKGLKIIEGKIFRPGGANAPTLTLDAAGRSDEEAKRDAVGKIFDSLFQVSGGEGFSSLNPEGQEDILSVLSPLLTVRGRQTRGDGVVLHIGWDAAAARESLEERGFALSPVRVEVAVGKNPTDLESGELQTRLAFLLSSGSKYYFRGAFYASPEALRREFEGMDLKLEGDRPLRMAITSIASPKPGVYAFTVDIL